MVDCSYHLQGNPGPVLKQRHRFILFSKKLTTGEILQLAPQQGSHSNRRLHATMVSMEERVLLHTLELDISSNSEILQRTVDTNTSNPTVAISNVVYRPNEVGNLPTNILTGNSGDARLQKRQAAFDEKQVLVFNVLAHKLRALLEKGQEYQAIDIILSNIRTDKRMQLYDPTKQLFLEWFINQGIIRPINAAEIVNFLSKSYAEDKLALSKIKEYKSALMHLCNDPLLIALAPCFTNFFSALKATSIISFVRPSFDITPVITRLKKWGPCSDLEIKPLTSKLYWFLSICGFLRASKIRRIDNSMKIISNDVLRLVVIKSHADPLFCHVEAYKSYILHVKDVQCMWKHENHSDTTLSMLACSYSFRFYFTPTKYPTPQNLGLITNFGSCRGFPSPDIVAQAFWSNYYMFENYYRLSRNTNSTVSEPLLLLE
ncbi:hypothetical protein AYI68_g3421 [Smittium mucronatum]|uniref:Uncharacterized protein n=1 Tax=Smittium mucronatum TaxID=133383 RepID=A0A1R0GZZ3_9FUNG|nr:hypothetical protein AYI68_g3421 [Smittium mucronatum]